MPRVVTGTPRALGALAIVLALGLAACAPPKRSVTGWVPYWSTDTARATIQSAGDLLSEVSPFWFRATGATTLVSDEPADDQAAVVAEAKAANIPLIPTVRDGMPAGGMAAVLADPAQRAAHVATLVHLVQANGYAGIDLDYEQFAYSDGIASWAATRPNWVQFVAELGAALHAQARLLTVTTPPIYNGTRAAGSGYWVYDWAAIAPHADRLRVMAYEFSHSSSGPMAPIWWVEQIVAYAVQVVPRSKIQIGVPAYGRDFVDAITGTCPSGIVPTRHDVRNSNLSALVQQEGATPTRDGPSGEMTFSYVDRFTGPDGSGVEVTCDVGRSVWYPDVESMLARARLVSSYGVSGVAQWALGFEDPAQWQPLREHAATLPHPAGVDPTGAVEVVAAGAGHVVVGGWAFDPEADLPIQVRITTGAGRTTVLANWERADIAAAYPGAGPYHGFAFPVPARSGHQTVCVDALGVGAGARTTSLGCTSVRVG